MRVGPVELPSVAKAVRFHDRSGWLEGRRRGLGASDVPKLLGLSPYGGPWSVYASKRWGDASPSSPDQLAGLSEERRIVEDLATETGWRVIGPLGGLSLVSEIDPLVITPDAFAFDGESWGIVEIKVDQSGFRWGASRRVLREWTADAGEWCREDYYAQVSTQLLATGLPWAALAVRQRVGQLKVFKIYPDPMIADVIASESRAFWAHHVVAGEPPEVDDSDACSRALARMYPARSELVREATEDEERIARRIELLRDTEKRCAEERKALSNQLAEAVGDAYGVRWPSQGKRDHKVLWQRSGGGTVVDVDRLLAEHPDLRPTVNKYRRPRQSGRSIRVYLQGDE